MSVYRTWTVASSSGTGTYDVTERDDSVHGGTYLHCQCQGWGPARGKGRDCRHVAGVRDAENIPADAAMLDNLTRSEQQRIRTLQDAVKDAGRDRSPGYVEPDEQPYLGRYGPYDALQRSGDVVAMRWDVFHTRSTRDGVVMTIRWHVMAANELDAMVQAMADKRSPITAIFASETIAMDAPMNGPDFDATEWAANTERKQR